MVAGRFYMFGTHHRFLISFALSSKKTWGQMEGAILGQSEEW
jgi:hypothetical protein